MKVNPAATVTVNFMIMKAGKFVLTKPASKGLSSTDPKYSVPITVVKQSIAPMKIRSKLGMDFVLSKIRFSPLPLKKMMFNWQICWLKIAENCVLDGFKKLLFLKV